MKPTLRLFLLMFAFVFFAIATTVSWRGEPPPGLWWNRFIAAGLTAATAALLFG